MRDGRKELARRFVDEHEGPGGKDDEGGEGDEEGRMEPGGEDHGDVGGEAKGFDGAGHVVEQVSSYL